MKINSKKMISLLLVFAMVLSILPAITLTTRAAEIERPQGISIVQDFDIYEKRLTEDGEPQWLESLGLPETVKVGDEEKAVIWADFKTYVDMSIPGYYALPGTVEGVEKQTYIVIQVREKINLMDDFEGDFEGSRNNWYLEGVTWANHSFVQDPVQHGDYALKAIYTGTKTNMSFAFLKYTGDYASVPASLSDLVTGGTYYFGIYGRVGTTASETDRWLGAKLQYSTDAATAIGSGNNVQYHVQKLDSESWKSSYLIVDLPADTAWVWPYITYSTDGGDANGDEIYLDNAELVNIDVLPLEVEPATMTEVAGDAFAPVVLAKDYDKYVADWKEALALPSEVTVAGSDGTTGTANVVWDYSALDLTKPGKYVLTGELASAAYLNVSDLTVEQIVLINEASNLIFNGDFTDGSTGRTGWSGDWICAKVSHPTDTDRTVLNTYRPDARRWYTQVLGQQTDDYKTDLAAKLKEGQYYFAIDIMSVDYDASNAAREDLLAEINFLADGSELTTNVNTAVKVNEWTTISEIINTTGTYASVTTQLQVRHQLTTNNAPASLYLTNFRLILLKATLSSECTEHTYTDYVTAPTCVDAGYTEHVCFACGYSYTDTFVDALGHSAPEQTDCTVAVNCTVCGVEVHAAKDHTYVDGKCTVCGAEEPVTGPVEDAGLKYWSKSISFEQYIGLQFIMDPDVYGAYDSVYVETVKVNYKGEATEGKLEAVPYYGYFVFNMPVDALSMTDEITLVLYAEKDGVTYVGEKVVTSVEGTATGAFATYAKAPKVLTALVDMLNFGAEVQKVFAPENTNLPNANLGEYASYATTTEPVIEDDVRVEGSGAIAPMFKALNIEAKVEYQMIFAKDMSAYEAHVTIGTQQTQVIDGATFVPYSGYYAMVIAFEPVYMRDQITITFHDKATQEQVSASYIGSVEGYAAGKLATLPGIVTAMMRYSDAVVTAVG